MSIQAEQGVLGGVLLVPEKFVDIADKITAADFTEGKHRDIWQAFVNLDAADKPLDLVSVVSEIGQPEYLSRLYHDTPSAANILHYVDLVLDSALDRRLRAACSEAMEIAKGEKTPREKLDQAVSKIMAVSEVQADEGPRQVRDYLGGWMNMLEERVNASDDLIGCATGIVDLDKITAGLQRTDLIIVAGRPSMGKTTLAMNFAEQAAVHDKKNVLVFSMEMSAQQLITRSVSSLGSVDQTHLRLARLDDSEWGKVATTTGALNSAGLHIDETPGLTILDLRARARRVHRRSPLDLIVVDYIQLMSGQGENQNMIVSEISRGLKGLAKELRVPVVALSQLNRAVDKRSDPRPQMSDLRDSGAIEQDADVIMFVYREEVYKPDTPNKGLAEIIIRKQRNGETGTVRAAFQGSYCRFKNWAGEIYDSYEQGYSGGFPG